MGNASDDPDGEGAERPTTDERGASEGEPASADVAPADAFAALSDPLRVDILEALSAFHREDEPVVRYSTLRKAVDVRDSGRFRYHLDRLRGTFVRKVEDGYQLTYAGTEVVTAIVAGTYTSRERLGPVEIDSDCRVCGATARAVYEDGVLSVDCADDHRLFVWTMPPNAVEHCTAPDASEGTDGPAGRLDGRSGTPERAGARPNSRSGDEPTDLATVRRLVDLATTLAYQAYELLIDGVCPDCYSGVDGEIRSVDADGPSVRFTARCDACGSSWDAPVGFALLTHPEVEALYHRLGRPIRDQYWWELDFAGESAEIERLEDPAGARLTVHVADAIVRATIDDRGQVGDLAVEE